METIKLWARHGDAVRQALELGELVHLEPASEELTDAFLLFAIQSGLLSKWAEAFPDPRQGPEISMRSRGDTLATLRTLLDHAGLITQVGLCPIQVHDVPACRLLFETAPVLSTGDVFLEDRGFLDGSTITLRNNSVTSM